MRKTVAVILFSYLAVAAWAQEANPGRPTVSTPVNWKEIESARKRKDASLLTFQAPQVLKRVEKLGDLFERQEG